MAPPRKTVEQYEAEAASAGGCLIHPSSGAARKTNILRHGPMPEGLCVLHTCDNPKCIADWHHWRGTKAQNTQDAVAKGRHSGFRKGGVRFVGGHTEEYKQRVSEISRERWSDPEYRANIAAKRAAWWESPEGQAWKRQLAARPRNAKGQLCK